MKVRLALVFLFLIGHVDDGFTADLSCIRYTIYRNMSSVANWPMGYYSPIFNPPTGGISYSSMYIHGGEYETMDVRYTSYHWNEGKWNQIYTITFRSRQIFIDQAIANAPDIKYEYVTFAGALPTAQGCKTCLLEKTAKRTECGGDDKVDLSTWNDQTCSGGQCKTDPKNNQGPPCQPGQCCQ